MEIFLAEILLVMGSIYLMLAIIPARKNKNKSDYFLAGRGLGLWQATSALIATQLGAGLLLGTSQQAYQHGFYAIIFVIGVCFGLIMLGSGVAGKLREMNIATATAIFYTKYHSPLLQKIASLIVTATLFGILIGNIVASKLLLSSLGATSVWVFLFFGSFIIFYTMLGGLKAVVYTDVFQVTCSFAIFIPLFFYILLTQSTFLFDGASWTKIQQQFGDHVFPWQKSIRTLLIPAFFALFEQDLAQIFFAARSKSIAMISAFMTSLSIFLFSLIPIFLGLQTHIVGLTVAKKASPLLPIIQDYAGQYVMILAAAAILAAIASTSDALLCAIAGNICQDFDLSFLRLSELVESKLVVSIIGILGLAGSFFVPSNIISILVTSYSFPVSALLVSFLFAYCTDNVSKLGAACSIITGLFTLIICNFIPWITVPEVPALVLSLLGYVFGTNLKHFPFMFKH